MTKDDKVVIVGFINAEISKLKLKVADLEDFTGPISPDDAIGRVSRMDAINNRSVFEASMRNTQGRLDQLVQALKMIDDADFGICIKCRQSIPFERLKLRPEIRLCATCLKQ